MSSAYALFTWWFAPGVRGTEGPLCCVQKDIIDGTQACMWAAGSCWKAHTGYPRDIRNRTRQRHAKTQTNKKTQTQNDTRQHKGRAKTKHQDRESSSGTSWDGLVS